MAAEIIWSPGAEKSFDAFILFLELKWNEKVIAKLLKELNETLEAIAENPYMFPEYSKKKKLRKCVLRRRTILLYRVKSLTKIELAIFADTRQNPKK